MAKEEIDWLKAQQARQDAQPSLRGDKGLSTEQALRNISTAFSDLAAAAGKLLKELQKL